MAATTSNKGQIFTSDFVASFALFSLFLILFGTLWNTSIDMFTEEVDTLENQHDYTFSLLKTSGNPSDWNSSNVEIPGLYRHGDLDAEKFLELKDISNSSKRRLLKAQNLHIRVEYLNGSLVEWNGQNLQTYTNSGENSVVPKNQTVYVSNQETILDQNGERVELRYYTWHN